MYPQAAFGEIAHGLPHRIISQLYSIDMSARVYSTNGEELPPQCPHHTSNNPAKRHQTHFSIPPTTLQNILTYNRTPIYKARMKPTQPGNHTRADDPSPPSMKPPELRRSLNQTQTHNHRAASKRKKLASSVPT
ncbi:hypothetical protein BO94DRAFT_533579 [Aspergillus sclerotioniger CBS 115572]|uniref:Uncharacterized protein n=1 Tax=Aspergillus sclerotioniger CBS 115572 TaxID=1450535 RepID=A0A317X1F6_9EURO|nr:hypothetical protein BO94DRAFT_533579 [Aspergillus sclerotioniger CBS 115572]PWY91432.1 hypothetical protein BO94DRAFT_533579 [Aspergillus sclerotioniger CBS 115572]